MEKVLFRPARYKYDELKETASHMLETLDDGLIREGTRVLIKPNLLSPASPEQAITTHPNLIRAAAEYALGKGARVMVSDSSAVGTFEKVVTSNGVNEALAGLDIRLEPLVESVKVETGGRFKYIEISKDVMEADVVINLPKLKTHAQMGLTMGVKNLFGCVVGLRKPEWHFRVGEDKELFAELLVTIYAQIKPSINLMDGILAMEGQGPGTRGIPRDLGFLIGASDAINLDIAACRLVGMPPDELLTIRAAGKLGHDTSEPVMDGFPGTVEKYVIPEAMDLVFGPRFTRGFFRRHMADRPVNILETCKYCDECVKICPAGAIENPGRELDFDYDKCIRCYCCVEVCPHGAMEKRQTWIKKILKGLISRLV